MILGASMLCTVRPGCRRVPETVASHCGRARRADCSLLDVFRAEPETPMDTSTPVPAWMCTRRWSSPACRAGRRAGAGGKPRQEVRTRHMTGQLLELSDWLTAEGVTI